MGFPRYPHYKDSGVAWLGQVPEHWDVCALNYRYEVALGKMLDEKRITGNHLAPYLRNTDVQWARINIDELPQMDFANGDLDRYSLRRGDLLVCEGGEVGRAAIWEAPLEECYYQKALHRIRPTDSSRDSAEFLCSVFGAAALLGVFAGSGGKSTIAHLPAETLRRYRFPFPPPAEQTAIAAFLDRETGKIDELVAEQRRLMALLKEKRQAVISHAVTKGLNPDAPTKPSGIEWLGDVPQHWEVNRLKFVIASVKAGPFGSALTKDVYVSAGFRVYGQEQVIPNDFTIGDYFITPEKYDQLSQYTVSPGDILISCVGTFGKIAIVPDSIEPGIINPRLIRLRCAQNIKAEYLVEVMRSSVTFEQLSLFSRGGTMDVINIGTLSEICLALPPIGEQGELLGFIYRETTKFDALITEAQRAIDLLKERRTALISAAVTGQIDVRELAPEVSA